MAQPPLFPASRTPAPEPTPTCLQVELFGVPRLLAGVALVAVRGATLAEVAADLARHASRLAGPVLDPETGWPLAGYSFVVDERFTRDPAQPVAAGSTILLVSSAAGG